MFSPAKFVENYAEHGGKVDHMIEVVHYLMLVLFVGWTTFFFICLWKFRASKSPRASYQGVKNHVSSHMEIGVVIVEAVLLLGFAFPLWAERVDSFDEVQAQNPVRVRCIGYQYGWKYHYPGEDGIFGRIDRTLASETGDPCVDPTDPNGYDDFVVSSLKIPVGRPAILQVTSTDVIHNYSIVPMRIQQDAMPSRDIPMWFTPEREMETYVICGQLCGEGHAQMRGLMEVVSQKSYREWAVQRSEAAAKDNAPEADVAAL